MADVLKLLETRQGEKRDEQFANEMGFRGATLWRYKNRQSNMNWDVRNKMLDYFAEKGDLEMVGALLAYQTEQEFTSEDLSKLGKTFLKIVDSQKPGILSLVSAA